MEPTLLKYHFRNLHCSLIFMCIWQYMGWNHDICMVVAVNDYFTISILEWMNSLDYEKCTSVEGGSVIIL